MLYCQPKNSEIDFFFLMELTEFVPESKKIVLIYFYKNQIPTIKLYKLVPSCSVECRYNTNWFLRNNQLTY